MSGRSLLLVCISVVSVSIVVSGKPVPMPVTGKVIARESANTTTTIGVSVLENLPTGRSIDQIFAQLPTTRPLTTGSAPDGWTVQQNGREFNATGPARRDIYIRLDGEPGRLNDYIGKDVTIRTGLGGRMDDPMRLKIELLPKVSLRTSLDGVLTAPPEAAPGQPFLIGVAGPYRDGTWQLRTDAGSLPLLPAESIGKVEVIKSGATAAYGSAATAGVVEFLLQRPAPRPFVAVYPTTGAITGARYTDLYGEALVDAALNIAPGAPQSGPLSIQSGSALAIAGQAACVQGNFSDPSSPYRLLLDGKTELPVWGASSTMAMVGIPAGTAPGSHTIEVPGRTSLINLDVIAVQGSLDENRLWRGEGTTMRLRMLGTTRPFALSVVNETPGIITIDGGVSQLVRTPGGPQNEITRGVRGIQRGPFTITYSLPFSLTGAGCRGGGG